MDGSGDEESSSDVPSLSIYVRRSLVRQGKRLKATKSYVNLRSEINPICSKLHVLLEEV